MQYNFEVTENELLTRAAAAKIKAQIEDRLGMQETIDLASLDLSGVEVMTEVFAREFFSSLVMGPVKEMRLCDDGCALFDFVTFGHHIEILGARPAVVKVIEASLKQLNFKVIVSDLDEDFRKGTLHLGSANE